MTWGEYQALVQLSAGMNMAILSFVDISLPAIKERRRVFEKAQQELERHKKSTRHDSSDSDAQDTHKRSISAMDQKMYLLWKEAATFSSEEDSLLKSTGVMGVTGSVVSLGLLWYSAQHYNDPISLLGKILIGLSFGSLLGAFIINFMTASQAGMLTRKCNDIRSEMHDLL
ncbi:hypothetical protein IFJ82_02675 [Novacetimonas hansenii]|uniref:Uncharacterized protein n=1 Tax=Novacetimonas hansenii TaxID=436 RepID=A0AAW5ESD4_NOVHA|nr:hypothetical protein [Novacetimonas hansenii]MBL7238571.1 hypothetical protein [Novacetimonas hansenii]MCJ8354736.1 hypothetical protein [Novacetimonas hansenii]PYD71619.1 hypothetical protein CFR74_13965 [Novacetimonas hansenii]QOF96520.1 hypothetical protein IFJ82_02675 [Novacetimonas hansenii]RFP02901.1 hypothetical protein BGC30_05560 [Novacetimonas hansenii]